MQNGFNYRIAMLISLLLVFCFYGCRTSKKSIDKSRIEIEKKEVQIKKVDSSVSVQKNNAVNRVDSLSWSSYMRYFDLSYSGIDKDDYLEFTKTEKGFKLSGKGNVNIKKSDNKVDSSQKSNTNKISNDTYKVNSSSKTESSSVQNLSKTDKQKSKFSFGPTFGVLVGLIIFGIIIYLLPKKSLKLIWNRIFKNNPPTI